MPTTDESPDLTLEGLVHDLNNVFETIHDASLLLSKDSKHARLAATIARSVDRGQRMLGSFFEQSQASLDLDLILTNATESARDFLAAVRGPSMQFDCQVETGLRLRGHTARWERVFVNLFLNAAQVIDGDGRVEIVATRTATGIEITVSDNGPGISPKILPRIFEPGFSTRARRSGLGLHIVRTIVEKEGGTVGASNRPGGSGAQFSIMLPALAGG